MKKKLMFAAFAACSCVVLAGVPEGYVINGTKTDMKAKLTAFWCAIDNQATGTHDPNATTWVDLVGGQAFQLTDTAWGENFLKFAGTITSGGKLTGQAALDLFKYKVGQPYRRHSIELVFKYDDATSDGTLLEAQKGSGIMALRRPNEKKMYLITTAGSYNGKAVPGTEFCVLSMERDQYMPNSLRYNDIAQTLTGWESPFTYVPDNTTTISIGQQPDGTYPFAGRLYAIRVYEGQLTTEEATQNYLMDLQRYDVEPAMTVVSGSVSVGGRVYTAGEVVKTNLETTVVTVDAATDAVVTIDPRMTGLEVASGSLSIQDDAAGCVTYLSDLTLGAAARLTLPQDGLCVSNAFTAESSATVAGPGILFAPPATCPATLDNATYRCATAAFTWPGSGIAYIPIGQTVAVDDTNKVDALAKIVFLGGDSTVRYAAADAWELKTPVEGPGTFSFESAGEVTIASDNKNLTGQFFFTNTTVLVTHTNGLGSAQTQMCHFWNGDDHTIDFDRAEKLVRNDAKRLYRVRQDRTWLQRYWIEPNEKLRKNADPTLRARARTSAITIDGDASEPAWGNATWVTRGAPDRLDIAPLSDRDGFYFLFRSQGSPDEIARDRIRVVLYPPDADNTGKSYTFDVDLKNAAKKTAGGYTAELRAPVGRTLMRGELWRVKFLRNPDGNEPDIRSPLEVGEPWLKNGSFERIDEKGAAHEWTLRDGAKLVEQPGGQHALKLGLAIQLQCDTSSLFSSSKPRKVRVSFRGWGVGKVALSLLRYEKKSDGPNVDGGLHEIGPEPRYFSAVCEIPAREWIGVLLQGAWQKGVKNDITIDDVAISYISEEEELKQERK